MRILILGINHAPELVGIGPYTGEMGKWLAEAGHDVEVISAKPYYPDWAIAPEYRKPGWRSGVEQGVRITRVPLYVPARPNGLRRIAHHLSFVAAATAPALAAAIRRRPDLVMAIAPSLASVPLARLAARLARARSWLHIQDFEIGAALATGLLKEKSLVARTAARFECAAFAGFDRYSSISQPMCARLGRMGVPDDRIVEFRNWSDLSAIKPLGRPSDYRQSWNISTPHVALYSGNIANKQGVGIIVEMARLLKERRELTFVVCGEGPTRAQLIASAADLPNIQFHPLQSRENLGELLGLATIHLLPQLAGAADLVLPSKLTNMLASGRPVVATAALGTGLASEVEGCGLVTPPGDPARAAAAIERLIDNPDLYRDATQAARRRAEERWSRDAILSRIEREMRALIAKQ